MEDGIGRRHYRLLVGGTPENSPGLVLWTPSLGLWSLEEMGDQPVARGQGRPCWAVGGKQSRYSPGQAALTFSERLGRHRNSKDRTGISVASRPCKPNSCK